MGVQFSRGFAAMLFIRFLMPVLLFLSIHSRSNADFEAQLFEKYRKQNQAAVDKWVQEVDSALVRAATLQTSDPKTASALLRAALDAMDKEPAAPGEDRVTLRRRLHDALAPLESAVAQREGEEEKRKLDWARSEMRKAQEKSAPGNTSVSPPFFAPLPNIASLQVTPVVSADRRYVRIGVSGGFAIPRVNYTAVPVVTPTVLQGPGRGVTVLPIYGVRYQMVPVPAFTTGAINTTVVSPSGGGVSIGGYSSSAYSSISSGVPILSGVPYVNRLFGNRAFGSSTTGFGIAVSPQVIVLD